MEANLSSAQPGPTKQLKRVISALIILHFAAILTTVTSASSGRFAAPSLAVRLASPFRPYLQFLFLGASYRFFAPNLDPPKHLYFRLATQAGVVHWVELPHRQDCSSMLVYYRFWKMPQQIVWKSPASRGRTRRFLNRDSSICLASMIRQVVKLHPIVNDDGTVSPVDCVDVYGVEHDIVSPPQVRRAWAQADLRLFAFYGLGKYASDGTRIDGVPIREIKRENFVAQVLSNDVVPLVARKRSMETPAATQLAVGELDLPKPIADLIGNSPELLETPVDRVAIRAAIEGNDLPADE